MRDFTVHNKRVLVLEANEPHSPVVYLNMYMNTAKSIYKEVQAHDCGIFTLVGICNLTWDHDMTPWYMPPLSEGDTPCTGGADDYLSLLVDEIMPKAEAKLMGEPAWRGIAGYSLGGLFALYSLYHADVFSRMGSMSGSLWFDGIKDYVVTHDMKRTPDCMYFSLGDTESTAKNPVLQTVQSNTEEIEAFYRSRGINTTFVLNKGNHFKAADKRTAAGIAWMLKQ